MERLGDEVLDLRRARRDDVEILVSANANPEILQTCNKHVNTSKILNAFFSFFIEVFVFQQFLHNILVIK